MFNKICTLCNTVFKVENIEDFSKNFHKAKVGKYGFTARCKECRYKAETMPYKDKRVEYDRNRRTIKSKPKNCIVCGKEFLAQRDEIKCCSKECSKFKKKVYMKLNGEKYITKYKIKRQRDIKKRANFRKKYSEDEILYLKRNLFGNIENMARRLDRTRNAITKKIYQLRKELNAN